MNFNPNKSKVNVFRNGGPLCAYERWTFRGCILNVLPYYKYMVQFDVQIILLKKANKQYHKYLKLLLTSGNTRNSLVISLLM